MVSRARIVSIKELSTSTRDSTLELVLNFHHEPGQFLQLTLENVDSSMIWPDSRSFSIASYEMPNKQLRLIIKKEGKFTTKLFNDIKLNNILTVKLPYGSFLPPFDLSPTLCLAGGTGIAPFLSFFEYFELNDQLKNFYLFHSTKFMVDAIDNVYLTKELHKNYKLFLTSDIVHNFNNQRINLQDITNLFSKSTNIYICGNKSFNEYFKKSLIDIGYNNVNIEDW
jgi:ferredoxin-NADP reductase